MRNSNWLTTLAALVMSTLAASAALGQNWASPVSGSYGNPSNWTPSGVPVNPTFDLNSAGYTVTLPSAESAQTLAVQTDVTTLDLSSQTLSLFNVNVSTAASQTGSLTVLGPGSIIANSYSSSVNVGGAGTGQLTVNAATINFQGSNGTSVSEGGGSTITVDNGGKLENSLAVNCSGSVILNDGTLSDGADMSLLGGAMLSNGSTLSAFGNMTFKGNVSVDNSTVTSSSGVATAFTGSLTISDGGSVSTTGTITLPVTTTIDSGYIQSIADTYFSNSGTMTVELSADDERPAPWRKPGSLRGHPGFHSAKQLYAVRWRALQYLGLLRRRNRSFQRGESAGPGRRRRVGHEPPLFRGLHRHGAGASQHDPSDSGGRRCLAAPGGAG